MIRTHQDGSQPMNGEIFVFGSNLAGRHGKGAALAAVQRFGATYGVGIGLSGQSYAIPTKDGALRVLPIEEIRRRISDFVDFARANPDMKFFITRIGCELAGYRNEDIAPLFAGLPENCSIAHEWAQLIRDNSATRV